MNTAIRPKYLTIQQVAAYLGKSTRTVQRMTARGDLTAYYFDSKPSYLYDEVDALEPSTEKPE